MAKSKKNAKRRDSNLLKGIALGAPIGTFLGWILFDNIGLGAALGTASGAVVGSIIDEKR